MLITLLSTQLHEEGAASSGSYPHLFRDELLRDVHEIDHQGFVQRLVEIILDAKLREFQPSSHTLLSKLLSYSYVAYGMVFLEPEDGLSPFCSLSDQSLLLLLLLIAAPDSNPFQLAIDHCHDGPFPSLETGARPRGSSTPSGGWAQDIVLRVPFDQVFDMFLNTLVSPQAVPGSSLVLLSRMVQENAMFLSYALSRSELWQLVHHLLHLIYLIVEGAHRYTADHMLLCMSIIHIFSQDRAFIAHSQHDRLSQVTWYREHSLSEVSLSDLLFIICVRTLHYNLTRTRDPALQVLGLGILVNMSSRVERMSVHAAHRLLAMVDLLTKRYFKWKEQRNKSLQEEEESGFHYQVNMYTKFLQMTFEVLNQVLFFGLSKNSNFLYALLYFRETFRKFEGETNFSQCVVNIQSVIEFFEERLSHVDCTDYSNTAVMEAVMQKGQSDWKNIFFTYHVDEQRYRFSPYQNTTSFQTPLAWLVALQALPYWDPHSLSQFDLFRSIHSIQIPLHLQDAAPPILIPSPKLKAPLSPPIIDI